MSVMKQEYFDKFFNPEQVNYFHAQQYNADGLISILLVFINGVEIRSTSLFKADEIDLALSEVNAAINKVIYNNAKPQLPPEKDNW